MTVGTPPPIEYELTQADYAAMTAHLCAPQRSGARPWTRAYLVFIALAAVAATRFPGYGLAFLVGMLLTNAAVFLLLQRFRANAGRLTPRPGGTVLCKYTLSLDDAGIHVSTPHWISDHRWTGVIAAPETETHVFLQLDTLSAYTIPKSAFANAGAAREFVTFARGHLGH